MIRLNNAVRRISALATSNGKPEQGFSPQAVSEIMGDIYARGDRIMKVFLLIHLGIALGLAFFHDTWGAALLVAGGALMLFFASAALLPRSFVTRCIAGIALQTFVVLHIYQLQGLTEMHYFFFTALTMMIVYQDGWAVWPGALLLVAQHLTFATLNSHGLNASFFGNSVASTQLFFHFAIALGQAGICHHWSMLVRRQTLQEAFGKAHLEVTAESIRSTARDLRASETRRAAVVEAALDCVISMSHEGKIIEWNSAAERTFGYRPDEAIGQELGAIIVPPLYRDAHRQGLAHYLATGEGPVLSQRIEIIGMRRSGEEFPVELTITAIRSNGGTPTFTAYLRDITERRQAEEALRKYADIFHYTEQGMVIAAANGRTFEMANPAYSRMHGYTVEEMTGKSILDVYPPERHAEALEHLQKAHDAGHHIFESFHQRKDGSVFPVHIDLTAVKDPDGNLLYRIHNVTDITERRRAEEELKESAARFRQIADSMPQIVWTARPDGGMDYFNQRWYDYTGATFEQTRDWGWRSMVHPDDLDVALERWKQAVATGEPFESEYRFRHPDGTYRWHLGRAEPIRNARGRIVQWFGTGTDIEDQKQSEAALKAAYDHEHRIAAALQRSLLLAPRQDQFPGLLVEPFYDPALDDALVGGDFFDAFALEGGRAAFVVGDVSGKGLAAATHTAEVKYALRAFLREAPTPGGAMGRLNRFVCEAQTLEERRFGNFVVLAMAVVDPATGETRIAVAGAEAPLLLRANSTVDMVEASGLPLGIDPMGRYEEHTVGLAVGESLLLCTDGLTEARRGRELLGNEGVARLAQQASSLRSLHQMSQMIVEGARAFAGGRLQDDACLLLVRREPLPASASGPSPRVAVGNPA